MSSRTRVALWSFWEYVGFVINSLIFLLIGIEVHVLGLLAYWQPILLAIGAVLVGRAAAVYPLAPLAGLFGEKIPNSWRHVMFWGGIHGGVSLALALTLAADFPQRSLVLAMTFGVVAFSIVVQGLTIPSMMRALGVEMGQEDEYDRTRVRRMAVTAAIDELDVLHADHTVTDPVFRKLRQELDEQVKHVDDQVRILHDQNADWHAKEEKHARAQLLRAEKTAVQRAVSDGLISHHTAEELFAEADDQIDEISGVGPH